MKKLCIFISFLLLININSFAEDTITYFGLTNGDSVIANINFSDVKSKPQYHWSKPAIYEMAAIGVISGFSNGTFLPSSAVSNEQAITLILNAAGKKDEVNKSTNVTSTDTWSDKYIRYAMKNGIITEKIVMSTAEITRGTDREALKDTGVLIRDSAIKREEVCALLSRAFKLTETKDIDFYDNSQISDKYLSYVKNVVAAGIMSGKDDNMFDPKGPLTREQMAQILKNAEEYVLGNMKIIKKAAVVDTVGLSSINMTDEKGNTIKIDISGRNVPVLRNGMLSGKNVIRANDEVEYYIDMNRQVKFIDVIDAGISDDTSSIPAQNSKSLQGTVISNSPYFEQITIADKNGIKTTYSYGDYTEFYRDNVACASVDIVAGDTVYLSLDEIENLNEIRAISNAVATYGTIIRINGSNITVKSEETGETKVYNIANIPVYRDGVEVLYTSLMNGEYAKISTTNQNIVKVEIVDDERTLDDLYKGVISDISLIYDTITLKETEVFEDGKWVTNKNSFVTIPLDKNMDITYYGKKIERIELGEQQIGKYAYIATREDNKMLYKAKSIAIDVYNTEKVIEGNVKSYSNSTGKLVLKNDTIYTDNSTIFIENDKIIEIPAITSDNKVVATVVRDDGENIAKVIEVMPYEEEKESKLYSGVLYDIDDSNTIELRLFSEYADGKYTPIKKQYVTLNLTSNTRIFTDKGTIHLRDFSFDNKDFDFEGMYIYVMADGNEAVSITTLNVDDRPIMVNGTISKISGSTLTLKDAKVYDYDEEEWNTSSKKSWTVTSNTMIVKYGEAVKEKDLSEGQEVVIFKNQDTSGQNAEIIVVE